MRKQLIAGLFFSSKAGEGGYSVNLALLLGISPQIIIAKSEDGMRMQFPVLYME